MSAGDDTPRRNAARPSAARPSAARPDAARPNAARPIDELIELMRRLRDPEHGCPWDIAQNFSTIAPYTIEEAHEVVDAIEREDLEDLCDELGDLLLQVVFHARMGEELGAFDFDDVVRAIVVKMTRRHPHVFGDADDRIRFGTETERRENWEAEKARERADKAERHASAGQASSQASSRDTAGTDTAGADAVSTDATGASAVPALSALDGVAASLPALMRADKLQRRAACVGFDWPEIAPVRAKVDEELAEVEEAVCRGLTDALEDELGDLLFSVVNLTRHHGVDAESALRRANAKFERRFRRVETFADEQGARLDALDIDALDVLWERAKRS